jgi:ElaB/YqjD/DUF883 family membrane-anchored ribosome-binding protein
MNIEQNASHSTVEGLQDALVTELKSIAVEADKLLNEVACFTAEDFSAARISISEKLRDASSKLDDARIAVTKNSTCAVSATNEYVRDNPWEVMGIAAAAGMVIGVLLARQTFGPYRGNAMGRSRLSA